MIDKIINGFLLLIGIGIVLHYYAIAIAWGFAKGWAKVKHVIENTGTTTYIHKSDKGLNQDATE
jgi:hypothetical protein